MFISTIIKHNYNDGKHRFSYLKIKTIEETQRIYYKTARDYWKEINVTGIIYGTLTETYKNPIITYIKPWLCVSFLTNTRSYDFEFIFEQNIQ